MRRAVWMMAAGTVLLTACGGPRTVAPMPLVPDPDTLRQIDIYAAVIRELVTTDDNTFGAETDFPAVFVVDHPEGDAGNPDGGEPAAGEPFSDDVRRGLQERLADLPLRFVADADAVTVPVEDGGGVEDDGVVVTLGPIPEGGSKVEVGASLYAGPLAGTWLTYVVEAEGGEWKVTGTTGPVAIS